MREPPEDALHCCQLGFEFVAEFVERSYISLVQAFWQLC